MGSPKARSAVRPMSYRASMRSRRTLLSTFLLIVGLVIVVFAWAGTANNDVDEAICQAEQALDSFGSATPLDSEACEQDTEVVAFLIGGGFILLGLLGYVIRSSAGAAIDGSPATAHPASITEELKNASDLHAAGAISDEEYAAVKKRLLA
jgi:hypothetical protein